MRGRKLPKLTQVLTEPATVWTKIIMPEWYGGKRCRLQFTSATAIWYHGGLPPLPIRWVLVRDPAGIRKPQAFLCTDLDAKPADILGWYVHRWSVETTLQETRTHLGPERLSKDETQRQWSDLAIARTTRPCSACSPSTRYGPPKPRPPFTPERPPGTSRTNPPSATPSPPFAACCRLFRIYRYPG